MHGATTQLILVVVVVQASFLKSEVMMIFTTVNGSLTY
jgi:hypothetical protein